MSDQPAERKSPELGDRFWVHEEVTRVIQDCHWHPEQPWCVQLGGGLHRKADSVIPAPQSPERP